VRNGSGKEVAMKYIRTTILAFACIASLTGLGNAAGMMGSSAADRIRPWLGTWSCKSPGNPHTATFTPVFGGTAMRISETGKPPSEEIVTWDSKSHKWIDQYADASGMYNTTEGTQTGNTIRFRQVYPAGSSSIVATMASKNTYTTLFTAMMNGKMIQQRETCTRT
jgi:hypothetical protein